MSDMDDKVGAAYRSLGRDEPPSALDARILAASRAAVAKPSLSRRWAAPVSIAAVLVLAVGVTLRMQQERPGVEMPEMDAARPAAPAAEPVPAQAPVTAEKFEEKDARAASEPAKV